MCCSSHTLAAGSAPSWTITCSISKRILSSCSPPNLELPAGNGNNSPFRDVSFPITKTCFRWAPMAAMFAATADLLILTAMHFNSPCADASSGPAPAPATKPELGKSSRRTPHSSVNGATDWLPGPDMVLRRVVLLLKTSDCGLNV